MDTNKKIIDSITFLDEPHNSRSNLQNIWEEVTQIKNDFKKYLSSYLIAQQKESILIKLKQNIDKVSTFMNAFSIQLYGTNIKEEFALKISKCIKSLNATQPVQAEDYQLLKLYLEVIVNFGYPRHFKIASDTVQTLISHENWQYYNTALKWLLKALKMADLMYSLEIPRHELKNLLRESNDTPLLEEKLSIIAFKLIANANVKWHASLRKTINPIFSDNFANYSYQFCQAIGQYYLDSLNETNRKIWDIVNYPVIFFDIIRFERENIQEIQYILDIYKNTDFKTQQAICEELRNNKSVSGLTGRLSTLSKINDKYQDTTLVYSEIYFTEGVQTEWANSCQGVGYLIIHYDTGWVSLYNTTSGYMMKETGIIFDALLLDNTPDNLYFKVLKRDGWHLFKTSIGLEQAAWDSIELLCPYNFQAKHSGYILCRKDKTYYLFDEQNGTQLKEFENVQAIKYLKRQTETHLALKIQHSWKLFNLDKEQFIDNLPIEISSIDTSLLNETNALIILRSKNEKKILFDLQRSKSFSLDGVKKVHFASYSDVYCEDDAGNCFIIKDCEQKNPISTLLFSRLADYEVAKHKLYSGLPRRGMMIFSGGTVVRYDYGMELQGTYYITKYENKSMLWLSNSVGGGRDAVLCNEADNIDILGICYEIQNDIKVFFLIEKDKNVFLYVSYYSQLKKALDNKPNIKEIPHDLIPLSSNKVSFIIGNYLQMYKEGQWQIYEHLFGYHDAIQAEEFEALDYKNYLKAKKDNLWYLYDLSSRSIVSAQGAKSIELSAENKIVLIYDDYIRYLSYEYLPKCVEVEPISNFLGLTATDDLKSVNYILNLTKLNEYPGLDDSNHDQPFAKILLTYIDHQLLKLLNPVFIQQMAKLLDGASVDTSNIKQALTELINQIKEYQKLTVIQNTSFNEIEKQIKQKIRAINGKIDEIGKNLCTSLDIKQDIINRLMSDITIQLEYLKSIEQKLSITKDLKKLIFKLEEFKNSISKKQIEKHQEKQTILNMFDEHRHLFSGILRYWAQIDPNGEQIDKLYKYLIALADLYQCTNNDTKFKNGRKIIRKFYLNLIKIYHFDSNFINNYIISKIYNSYAIQDLLALLDALKINNEEKNIFNKALLIGPKLQAKYEDITDENKRRSEQNYLKEYMHILRLTAIAHELNCEAIYSINLNSFNKGNNAHLKLIDTIAKIIREYFYKNLGIEIYAEAKSQLEEQYMVDIIYAKENLKGNDKIILIIMLKAAIYQLDLKSLFTNADFLSNVNKYFSKVELSILNKLQEHNQKVLLDFQENKLNWYIWQNGVQPSIGENISIALWKRNVAHDLFQGEFCNSCISLAKGNARANLQYLTDFNFSMIEIIEKKHSKTIGHVTLWIGQTIDGELILVLNSIQVNKQYQMYGQEIRDLTFEYASQFSDALGIKKVVLGQGHNAVPIEVLKEIDDVGKSAQPDRSYWQKKSNNDQEESIAEVDISDLQIKIISSTFDKELYSDVYLSGWKTTEDMTDEDICVWDISLFRELAEPLPKQLVNLNEEIAKFIKDYEIWIINNPKLKGIKLCLLENNSLILINKYFWDKFSQQCFDKLIDFLEIPKEKATYKVIELSYLEKENNEEKTTLNDNTHANTTYTKILSNPTFNNQNQNAFNELSDTQQLVQPISKNKTSNVNNHEGVFNCSNNLPISNFFSEVTANNENKETTPPQDRKKSEL